MLRWVLLAYPDRVVRRRGGEATGVMVGGRGVRLAPESVVRDDEFFLALDPREDRRGAGSALEARVRIASAIRVEWLEELFPESLRRERSVRFDDERQRAVGVTSLWYRDLLLREDRNARVEPSEASEALAGVARGAGRRRSSTRTRPPPAWLARLEFLRRAMPEAGWPEFDAEALGEVVADACAGKRTVDEVRRVPLVPLLRSRLPHAQARALDELAPEALTVPSGNRIRLAYEPGRPPVLAVRLQELFGWTETPRLAGGRVAGRAPPARPELPAGAGHRRPPQLLGDHLFPGPQGPPRPLPPALLARRPADRPGRGQGGAAVVNGRRARVRIRENRYPR